MKRFLKEIYGKNNLDSVSSFMNKLRSYIIVVNARRLTISDNVDGVIVFSRFDKWNTLHEARLAENKKILETLNTRLEALNASIRIKHESNIKKQEENQLLLIEKIKSFKKKVVKLESTKREFIRQKEFLYKNRRTLHSILP